MKLIFCPKCTDIVKLRVGKTRNCRCAKSWGKYTDNLNATYGGKAIPLFIANASFVAALWNQPEYEGLGKLFTAGVVPKVCHTFKKESSNENN